MSYLQLGQSLYLLGWIQIQLQPHHIFIYLHENGTTNRISTLDIQ